MDASDRRRRAAEDAAEWWVLLQGDASHTQREQYVDWLRESYVHVAEMLRVAQVHGALAHFERWGQIPTDGSDDGSVNVVSLPEAIHPASPSGSPPKHSPRRLKLISAI